MIRRPEGRPVTVEELQYHYVGALLNGALEPPNSARCTIDRFRRVEEACIALAHVDGDVRLERVGDVLQHLGLLEELGGAAFLVDLAETWSERVAKARSLGDLLARAEVAAVHLEREKRAIVAAERAADRLHAARAASARAWLALEAAESSTTITGAA